MDCVPNTRVPVPERLRLLDLRHPGQLGVLLRERDDVEHAEPPTIAEEDLLARFDHDRIGRFAQILPSSRCSRYVYIAPPFRASGGLARYEPDCKRATTTRRNALARPSADRGISGAGSRVEMGL